MSKFEGLSLLFPYDAIIYYKDGKVIGRTKNKEFEENDISTCLSKINDCLDKGVIIVRGETFPQLSEADITNVTLKNTIKVRFVNWVYDNYEQSILFNNVKKYFFDFRAQDKTNVNRINFSGGAYQQSDTTVASTNSTSYVTVKTYTYNTSGQPTPRKLRVRVYGYIGAATDYMYVRIVVDGVNQTEYYTDSTTEVFIGEWILDIGAGTHTINVQIRSTNALTTAYLTKVYIIDCYAISSTTPVTISSFSFNPENEYTLKYFGNFKFEVGNRFKITVTYYRKTTANSVIATVDKSFNIASADDGNSVAGVSSSFYATTSLSNSTFNINMNVGASGDVIWIISLTLMVQVTLRGNQTDKYGNWSIWILIINSNGVGVLTTWIKSLDGINKSIYVFQPTPTGNIIEYESAGSTNQWVYNVPLNVYDTKAYMTTNCEDILSYSVTLTLIVQVVG